MVSGRCLTGLLMLGGRCMAYDRYDTQSPPRDERSRWAEGRSPERDWRGENRGYGGRRDERGFFERAGDEVASWFGDEEAERRRREDERMREREHGHERGWRPEEE